LGRREFSECRPSELALKNPETAKLPEYAFLLFPVTMRNRASYRRLKVDGQPYSSPGELALRTKEEILRADPFSLGKSIYSRTLWNPDAAGMSRVQTNDLVVRVFINYYYSIDSMVMVANAALR
jgi:hypothetical protein